MLSWQFLWPHMQDAIALPFGQKSLRGQGGDDSNFEAPFLEPTGL